MKDSATKKTFDAMATFNNFSEEVIAPAIAAEDQIIRATMGFLSSSNMPDDEAARQDIVMDLEKTVAVKYRIPTELSALAIRLCEDMIWRGEFEHGSH